MDNTIDQFMWGFQPHFRGRVEIRIRDVLSQIGLPVDVRVILVGFALDGSLRHQLCIEPEVGPLLVNHLDSVPSRTEELLKANPESKIRFSDPRSEILRRERLFRESRAEALVEAIESAGVFEGLTFFASASAPIEQYEVHTCVGVPKAALNALPALDDSVFERVYVGRSLQHEVISECLNRADRALYLPDPGTDLLSAIGTADDIIKAAAMRLTDGTVHRATLGFSDFFSWVNTFASLSYERAGASGHLVITPLEKVADQLLIRFQQPVPLRQARRMRKLLQLSDASTSVFADHQSAYGLGTDITVPDSVEITVTGHAEWELRVGGSALLRVAYGQATLPYALLDIDEFKDTAERILGPVKVNRLWSIIQKSQASGHGSALVVSSDPEGEAIRLGAEAVQIVPAFLEPNEIARLARVDGAVLLDPDGRCHAFGIILDGVASGEGDPARGSRFNSAVRYLSTDETSIVIVVSDDGTVDLIPRLRPQVRKELVEEAVHTFRTCCEAEYVDGVEFSRTYELVKRFAFYLDDEQCRIVNELYEMEMNRRFEAGGLRLIQTPLQPHPDMKESYFL